MSCLEHYEKTEKYSEAIYRCIDFLKEKNFTVISCVTDLPKEVAGRVEYDNRIVRLNQSDCAGCTFLTIFHEAGHVLHFLHNENIENTIPKPEREANAYMRGWALLRKMGYGFLVTKERWRREHEPDAYDYGYGYIVKDVWGLEPQSVK